MNVSVRNLLALLILALVCLPLHAAEPSFTGSASCESCHQDTVASWKSSHHYQSMLPANADSVLGNFDNQTFNYGEITSRFYRDGDKYMVETDNAKGEMQAFEITYTFGFFPLQQYLIPFEDGRLQALNVAWDSRPQDQGGQRWMHLYPDGDPVTFEDRVHWTGAFMNWNSRCAVCHSTGLEKNFSSASNRYKTTWEEVNVACEACHGPAASHLKWAEGDQQSADRGFDFSMDDHGIFAPASGADTRTFSRTDQQKPTRQVQTCAACHSRRSEISPYHAGQPFSDQYQLALLEPPLYFPDGQIDDEVYVYGSFLQSKMNGAGVVCTDCHDPHSNKLRANDNSLCTQCHVSAVFDQPTHHHHDAGSPGASCVNCHMPVKTYMVVDDRHDHSFRIPEPRLTLALGVPNTCNQCHKDEDAQWALDALTSWGISSNVRADHAAVLNAAWSGQPSALPGLMALANQPANSAILRSSAIVASGNFPTQDMMNLLPQWLQSEDPLVRASVARSMDWVPVAQRYALLRDYISDKSKAVRMAVARQLSAFPADQLPPEYAAEITTLLQEYQQSLLLNADMPEDQMNLGLFYTATGNVVAAEKAYRLALTLSPGYLPAMLNLADLYRANEMDAQAEPLLTRALELAPAEASVQHAMGLLRIRQGSLAASLPYLRSAAQAEPQNARYTYVYAVGLWETGSRNEAVSELEGALERVPGSRDIVSALASYYQQLGDEEKFNWLKMQYAPDG